MFMNKHIMNNVTASAYTQARKKLRHTAFKELSDDIVAIQYEDPTGNKLWKNFRLLGVDGSRIILPSSTEIVEEFGTITVKNHTEESTYSCATFECCYDVLNHLAITGILCKGIIYEPELALQILNITTENDILIYDRGYCSFKFIATLLQQKKNFIIRCQKSCFEAADAFFNKKSIDEVITLKVPKRHHKEFQNLNLPLELSIRFVAVVLSTGETEVLITSVIDQNITKEDFKELYGLRWEIETFFGILKGRLSLENFTGLSVESIKQDFWSTIFMSNYETIVTYDANQELQQESATLKQKQKVNKAVSFNVIKHQAFNILLDSTEDNKSKMQKLKILFKYASVPTREGRNPIRKKYSATRSCNFLRRKKKHIF